MDIDSRLHEAGQRWRESQGPALQPPSLDISRGKPPPRRWKNGLAPVAAAAAAAGIVFGIVSLHGSTTGNQVLPGSTSTPPSSVTSPSPKPSTSPQLSKTGVLWPADADSPAGGICGSDSGAVVTVVANPDTPAPRCLIVTANQRLRVVNGSNLSGAGKPITVTFADFAPRVVPIGGATLFDRPLGEYIAPGVHSIHISLYGSGGGDVWLKP